MRYTVKDNIKEEMLKIGGELTPSFRGLTLEDYLIGCEFYPSALIFDIDKYDIKAKDGDILMGWIKQTNHPMPYFNIMVHLPKTALQEII